LAVLVAAGAGGFGLTAQAQQPAAPAAAPAAAAPAGNFDQRLVEAGFKIWKTKIMCGECHGWSGNGNPDNPRQPRGANLRQTQLTHDQLIEVIKCGRPGAGMPHFDQRAYKDNRCYGVTEADLGDQTPPSWSTALIPREIEAVATYVEAKIKGRSDFTIPECEEYFGAGAKICETYARDPNAQAPQTEAPRAGGGGPH
jgi:cytochrome c553